MKKITVIVLILSLILVFIPSCGFFLIPAVTIETDTKDETEITETETETETEAETEEDTQEFSPEIPVHALPYYNTGRRYAWSTLNKEKRQLYYEVLTAALCYAEYVMLPDADTAKYIYECVFFDSPELFYLSETPKIEGNKLIFDYVFTLAEAEALAAHLTTMFYKFRDFWIKDGMTDYEKLQTLYEHIINRTKYADEADEDYESNVFNEAVYRSISAIGPLIDGKAICIGYARATQYLALRLGIQAFTVKGADTDGDVHYYNLILLGDDYYYVDTTWGDPVDPERVIDYLTYNYFCITTDELLRSHQINTPVPLPVCTATEYNYFIYNGLTAETAEEAANKAYEAYMRSETEVRLKVEYEKLDTVYDGLKDAMNRIFIEKGLAGVSYAYGRSKGPSTVFVKFTY